MLLTNTNQKLIFKRIEEIVSILMKERPIFEKDINYAKIVNDLVNIVQENLSIEDFNSMSDAELKEHCSFVMTTEILSKIGSDFTSEQMIIFNEAIKRK